MCIAVGGTTCYSWWGILVWLELLQRLQYTWLPTEIGPAMCRLQVAEGGGTEQGTLALVVLVVPVQNIAPSAQNTGLPTASILCSPRSKQQRGQPRLVGAVRCQGAVAGRGPG
ncbi:geminin [Platysternon megacephalum]|uniref:Geminin n=1 Tax=Platysternon megacephalum TaxID=55544 RepID=A0A4D9DS22_9SAUR|nr:geminin [Platysternon megacephalum]